jgi:hypothetical protein
LPLSEKVRIEIFIPDLPDPANGSIIEQFGNELTYAFGGCTIVEAAGKYLSYENQIVGDRVKVLFSDTTFLWTRDRLALELYADRLRLVVHRAISQEESILVAVHPVYHAL